MLVLSDFKYQTKKAARTALDILTVAGSAEKSLDFLLPGDPGTDIGKQIGRTPVIGKYARKGFDYGLSPLSLSSAFIPPLAAARGASLVTRLGLEAGIGAGAGIVGEEAAQFGGEHFGTPGAIAGGLLGGAAAGIGLTGIVRARLGLNGKTIAQVEQATALPTRAPVTVNDIHKLAESKGIKWDNDPDFLKYTKALTGKEHLDDLNFNELRVMADDLTKGLKVPDFDIGLRTPEPLVEKPLRSSFPSDDNLKFADDLEAERLGEQVAIPDELPNLIERGRVVYSNKVTVDSELNALIASQADLNRTSSTPRNRELFMQWFDMDEESVANIRNSFVQADADAKLMYWEGRGLRRKLNERYPDGYVTLYRGEVTQKYLGEGVPPIHPDDLPVQSFSSDPGIAASSFFTGQYGGSSKIMEVKVPIDAIISPGATAENEVLVMMPSKISDTAWKSITGTEKSYSGSRYVTPIINNDDLENPLVVGYFHPEGARKLADAAKMELGDNEFRHGVDWAKLNPKLLEEPAQEGDVLLRNQAALPSKVGGGAGDTFSQKLEDYKYLQKTGEKPAKINYTPKEGEVADFAATKVKAESFGDELTLMKDGSGRWRLKSNFAGQVFIGTPEELAQKYGTPIVYSRLPGIKGGADPIGELIAFNPVRSGLTISEHINDIYQRTSKFLIGKGTPENAIATPLIRDYSRIVAELNSQGNAFAAESRVLMKTMGDVHNLAGVDFLAQQGGAVLPQAQKAFDRFIGYADAYNKLLLQRGIIKDVDPDPLAHIKKVLGPNWNNKPVDAAILEYTEKMAESVARNRLRELINDLGLTIGKGEGKSVPGIIGQDLPPDIAAVIAKVAKSRRSEGGVEHVIDSVNGLMRGLWATGDASFFGIQGLLMAADNPARAGTAISTAIQSISDSAFIGKYISHFDEARYGIKPTSVDWRRYGLHFAGELSEFTLPNTGIAGRVGQLPGIKHFNRLFTNSGDVYRLTWADALYEPGMADDELRTLTTGVNRATGYSRQAFGGSVGESAFFAPRFLQSQIETTIAGVRGLAPGASLDQQVARNALLKLIGIGTGMTFLMNEVRGKDTELNPADSNFMRVRDVMGSDISLFGPWDSLVRAMTEAVQGNPQYALRTKASPALSLAWDLISGKDFRGEDVYDPSYLGKILLPFSSRDIGKEQLPLVTASFLGIKTTPLTENEQLNKKMESANLDPNDPLDRRVYLSEHPEDRPESNQESTIRAGLIRDTHKSHIAALDKQIKSGEITLVDWRESRKLAYTDERARLDEIISEGKGKGDKQRLKVISSYMELYGKATDATGQVDPDLFDRYEAEWVNTYGESNRTYVEQFLLAGKSDIEKQYLNDLQQLDKLGYFDMERYENRISSLDGETLDKYRDYVSAVRSSDPEMAGIKFSTAAFLILDAKGLSAEEIYDVVHAIESNYTPEYIDFKAKYNKLLQWFNPNATWDTYQAAQEKVSVPKAARALPKIGGRRI